MAWLEDKVPPEVRLIAPVVVSPFVEPTVPTLKEPLSTNVKVLTPLAANVPITLLALLRLTAPPVNNKLLDVTAPLAP